MSPRPFGIEARQ